MRATKIFFAMIAVGVAFGATETAHAAATQGVVLTVKELDKNTQTDLFAKIATARVKNPVAFKRVAEVVSRVPELDKQRRGPFATITLGLKRIGPDALMPMLEMLAVNGPPRGNMTPTAWTTLRVGLIEAVGIQRDPVAEPVLSAILDKETDYWVVRAAAEALGRIGSDASAKKLVALASKPNTRQKAVLSALGNARRPIVARALAKIVATPLDYESAKLGVKALGDVGNAWAWKTPALAKTGEAGTVRSTAAKALVDSFVHLYRDKYLRTEIQKSLLLVDDPASPGLIEGAKNGASAELAAALDALEQKLAHSPLHKY
jgi:hypothetical protein